MPEPINSTGIEFSVWCTPDNQRLLFSSTRSGGPGGEDLYECRRDATTPTGWSEPHILAGPINTWMIESCPAMGFDTTEIFFWRSDRLYASHLIQGSWTQGEALPDYINRVIISFPSETTPCILPNGGRLYFSSRWNDSMATAGDIWFSERPLRSPDQMPHREQGIQIEVFPNPAHTELMLQLPMGCRDFGSTTSWVEPLRIAVCGIKWDVCLGSKECAITLRDLLYRGFQRNGFEGGSRADNQIINK